MEDEEGVAASVLARRTRRRRRRLRKDWEWDELRRRIEGGGKGAEIHLDVNGETDGRRGGVDVRGGDGRGRGDGAGGEGVRRRPR